MARTLGVVIMLLLLSLLPFIQTGVNGQDNLILGGRGYDIRFPCNHDFICFLIWQFSTRETTNYIALVKNGVIQSRLPRPKNDSRCTLQTNALKIEDVGDYRCQQRPDTFSQHDIPSSASETNIMTVSLHCALLGRRSCTKNSQRLRLQWVDEAGDELREDSEHRLGYWTDCNVTLTVSRQTLENKKFRCKATVGTEVQISVAFPIKLPGARGRGRGIVIHPSDPEQEGGNQGAIGAGVGVVGCVVLTAVVALFVINRRANGRQLHDDAHNNTTCADDDVNADDVIYADIILPTGRETVRNLECQSTEYACVRIM